MARETPDGMGRCRSERRMTAEERSTIFDLADSNHGRDGDLDGERRMRGAGAWAVLLAQRGRHPPHLRRAGRRTNRRRPSQATPKRSARWLARPPALASTAMRRRPADWRSRRAGCPKRSPGSVRATLGHRSRSRLPQRADRPPKSPRNSTRLASRGEAPRSQVLGRSNPPRSCRARRLRDAFSFFVLVLARSARTHSSAGTHLASCRWGVSTRDTRGRGLAAARRRDLPSQCQQRGAAPPPTA